MIPKSDICQVCGRSGAHYVRDGGGPWHKLCIPPRGAGMLAFVTEDDQPQVNFCRIGTHTLPLPAYETAGAVGMDLRSREHEWLRPGEVKAIPTGWSVEISPGHEGQVRPRSGLAARRGITVLNTPGSIDADYRGELMVILINHGRDAFEIKEGDRIAQLVIAPVVRVRAREVTALSETERGTGGLGSTGV